MKKFVMLTVVALLTGTAFCSVTTHLSLDCRGAKVVDSDHPIVYDATWYAGGVTAKITANGREIVSGMAGTYEWMPSTDGVNLLTLNVYNDSDEVVGTEQVLCLSREDITDLVIPEGTAEIGSYAFAGGQFTSVTIPSRVTNIGGGAFCDCSELMSVTILNGVISIGDSAFENDYFLDNVVIPDSVETVGTQAFKNCTEMISLEFGGGLKSVGDSAFENCISLESVAFEEGLESLGARSFASDIGSMRLKSVVLPASMKSIEDGAFDGCDYITGVTVPTHLKTMAELFPGSFEKIESVVIPEGVSKIVARMFKGCKALKSIAIPNTVVTIGESAFEGCEALSEIGLPDSVEELGVAAFSGCLSLQTAGLSKNLIAIRDRTFEKCPLLDSLVVPASVRVMGSKIYGGYRNEARLTGVYFFGDAPEVQSDTYEGMPSALISYVVKGSRGWYLAGSPTLPPNGWPQSGNTRSITYWTPNRFDVLFDGNGGSPATYYAEQITDTTYSLPKTNPARSGYLFDGWWTEKTDGARITANSRVTATKEHTLYAHWKLLSDGIRVIFNPNGGTVDPAEMYYPAGVTYGALPVPTRIGHRFLGWYTSQTGGTLVTEASAVHEEDNEFYAHWTPITYTIAYNANGGSGLMGGQTHTYNVPQTLCDNQFTFAGRAFQGWAETAGGQVKYANGEMVENLAEIQDQVVTLYAVWGGASYAVRFDSNGGYGSMDNQTFLIGVSQPIAKCAFTRSGYRFAGWATTYGGSVVYSDQQSVQNLSTVSGATVVLYAVWTADGGGQVDPPVPTSYYTVTFNANGGTCSTSSKQYASGATLGTLPTATRSGYTFDGWYTAASGGTKVASTTAVTKDVTYYAHWTQTSGGGDVPSGYVSSFSAGDIEEKEFCGIEYMPVVVDPNGASGSACLGYEPLGEELELPTCMYQRSGYIFTGWKVYQMCVAAQYDDNFSCKGVPMGSLDWFYSPGDKYEVCSMMALVANWSQLKTSFSTSDIKMKSGRDWDEAAVLIDPNGGDGGCKLFYAVAGARMPLPECMFQRTGYAFDGWDVYSCCWASDGNDHYYNGVNVGSYVGKQAAGSAWECCGVSALVARWRRTSIGPIGGNSAIECNIKAEYRTKADVGVIPVKVVNVKEAVKIAVKGLPSGVKFTAKDVVDRKTKKVTVPANSIYGTPTKSGVYAATVTVTPTDRKSKMAPIVKGLMFVVRNPGEHIVRADCDAAQGTVKGMGVYAKGKKVTLKATAVKGWVFSGWYDGDDLVSRLASYVLTMPEGDVNLSARFISVSEDKAAIRLAVDGTALSGGSGQETASPLSVEVRVGMYVEWPVAASALSATTVKVSGLPSGLKFTAKDVKATKTSAAVPANTIYGTPKTASKVDKNGKVTPSKVKITVTTAGKQKQEYVLNVTVRGIPAEGTFDGGSANGLVTLTVAKTGKISGKYLADGKTWTLSAAGFDTWDDNDRMTATLTAKSGKEVKTVRLTYEDGRVCASLTSGQETASPLFEAWRNEWKTEPQKSLAAKLKGKKVQVGEVLLTVGSSGAVTAKGSFVTGFDEKKQKDIIYSASCSTVLIPTAEAGQYRVYLYFPPKTGKFDGFTDVVEIGFGDSQ